MSADTPQKTTAESYDVVLMHGPTADGEGARVLRARADGIEAGEVRPLQVIEQHDERNVGGDGAEEVEDGIE